MRLVKRKKGLYLKKKMDGRGGWRLSTTECCQPGAERAVVFVETNDECMPTTHLIRGIHVCEECRDAKRRMGGQETERKRAIQDGADRFFPLLSYG